MIYNKTITLKKKNEKNIQDVQFNSTDSVMAS